MIEHYVCINPKFGMSGWIELEIKLNGADFGRGGGLKKMQSMPDIRGISTLSIELYFVI